jgi:hypothetical protein
LSLQRELSNAGTIITGALIVVLGDSSQTGCGDALLVRRPGSADLVVLNDATATATDLEAVLRTVRKVWRRTGSVATRPITAQLTASDGPSAAPSDFAVSRWRALKSAQHRVIDGVGNMRAIEVRVRR